MSGGTIKSGNLQVGQDGTASNNFTWYQPAVADGTVRLGQGVAGATTKDMVTISGSTITLGGNLVQASTAAPAFSAYNTSGDTTISSGVYTKILFPTEEFDTNSNFASSRFTPTVAGYYQINSSVSTEPSVSLTRALISIFKNGSQYQRGTDINGAGVAYQTNVSSIVYCNGTTDYIEIWMYIIAGTPTYRGIGQAFTWVTGAMIRSA